MILKDICAIVLFMKLTIISQCLQHYYLNYCNNYLVESLAVDRKCGPRNIVADNITLSITVCVQHIYILEKNKNFLEK